MQSNARNIGVTVVLLGLTPLAFLLGERFVEVRTTTRRLLSDGRFEQIRGLLLAYHRDHGRFPPTKFQANKNGPNHSWRVLLLPYIDVDYRDKYSRYDFSRSWNSAENVAVTKTIPNYFGINSDRNTNFLALGDKEEWPTDVPLLAYVVTKGKDRFLLVDYPDSKVFWAEPTY